MAVADLREYTKIVIETDEENPVTIAEITAESVEPAEGYRIRLTPDMINLLCDRGQRWKTSLRIK